MYSDFPLQKMQAQPTLFESNYERLMLCDAGVYSFNSQARTAHLHKSVICMIASCSNIYHLPVIHLASDCFIVGVTVKVFRFLISGSYKFICDWIVAGRPSEPQLIFLS